MYLYTRDSNYKVGIICTDHLDIQVVSQSCELNDFCREDGEDGEDGEANHVSCEIIGEKKAVCGLGAHGSASSPVSH